MTLHPDATGGWTGAATFNWWSTPGRWTVIDVGLSDAVPANNTRGYTPGQLTELGLARELTVPSTPDLIPPTLTDLKISPTSLNTHRSAKCVGVRATLRDADSGVRGVGVGAHKVGSERSDYTDLHLASGSARRGVWAGDLRIKRWNAGGTWLFGAYAYDRSGWRGGWGSARLRQRGFVQSLRVASATDDRRPAGNTAPTRARSSRGNAPPGVPAETPSPNLS